MILSRSPVNPDHPPRRSCLEHPFSIKSARPIPRYFDIDYELIPQSVDLSRAISIQAVALETGSFTIDIYSVPHIEFGRMRAGFKVKESTFTEIPDARQAWGDDRVTSELCFPYQTQAGALASLRVFSDDAIELIEKSGDDMGRHEGTRPEGQSLLSAPAEPHASAPVYCDGRAIARAPVPYCLTVERAYNLTAHADARLSSALSPKVLDEVHDWREPARTFFLERQAASVPDDQYDPPLALVDPARFLPQLGRGNVDPLPLELVALPRGKDSGTQLTALFASTSAPTATVRRKSSSQQSTSSRHLWRFFTFWHPQAVGFRRLLESRGLPRLVRIENQQLSLETDLAELRAQVEHFWAYHPTRFVDSREPQDLVDFTLTGPFSEYNWELFFDSLLYIAQRFDEEGRYDDADEIFALLVDRTRVAKLGAWDEPALYQTAPIRAALTLEEAGPAAWIDHARDEIEAQIERIRQNPYQPHLIARGWPTVYARALRIRYAEHLIHAGEADFRRAYAGDNRSYLDSASMRFDLAARVLGPAEDSLAPALDDEVACFASLANTSDEESPEGIEVLEPYLQDDLLADGAVDEALRGSARRQFCVPPNDKLNELRALVADRLLKLRSCEDIDGVQRALSLYGQRIDPALLVRATAAGLDLDVLLGRLSSAKPSLYFQALWQRAFQACEQARSLEDAWFSAQERADSEAMALLQNEQEIRSLEDQVELMSQRLEDARKLKDALDRALESAQIRHEFYSSRKRLNAQEETEGNLLAEAGKADDRATSDSRAASDWAWIPTGELYADSGVEIDSGDSPKGFFRAGATVRSRVGGETGVEVYRNSAEGHAHDAAKARVQAGLMGREGSFQRRADDWKLQDDLALKDIAKGEHDSAGAEIRVRIAELELDLHQRKIDDVKSVRAFLRDKVTSKELQAWRADRLRQLRYQQHQVAYELVSQARAALVREHGLDEGGFVADPWDSSRHGVAAASVLLHELEKQQQLYLETWRREQEKVKSYSLVERDPLAFLELIQRGETVFSVSEADYDEDGAGDYFRRIRHVSLDVPAIRGPHTNVNARLTQLKGEVRRRAHLPSDSDYYRSRADDPRFRDDLTNGEFIVTNTGIQDDGRLDQRQDGENPPPFCMNGAISTFRLELSPEQNHFDRQTISDVIVGIGLTSRAGGTAAMRASTAARRRFLADRPQPVMLPLHSAFSNAWYQFVDALAHDGKAELALTFDRSHVPLRLQPVDRIVQTSLYFSISDDNDLEVDGANTGTLSAPPELQPSTRRRDDPHIAPPIRRLNLREPLGLGVEKRIPISRRAGAARLERGWVICWLQGTSNR